MKILCFVGTRPEMIKMVPLVEALDESDFCQSLLCSTGQQKHLLEQKNPFTARQPDFKLHVMRPGMGLTELTSDLLSQTTTLLDEVRPDLVLVHGDTTTAMSAALAAFYARIDIGHVEAGLRTGDITAPFPEELNRRLIAQMARLHFAPTHSAFESLIAENIAAENIFVTGNTGIDMLLQTRKKLLTAPSVHRLSETIALNETKKLVVVTIHRRENFGGPLLEICAALREIASRPDVQILLTVHPNPNVEHVLTKELHDCENLALIPPQDYADFVCLLSKADLVLSDSGGLQEEVPALGKPLLILRETTERPEALAKGHVMLVGTTRTEIVTQAQTILDKSDSYIPRYVSPYGDGMASKRITKIIKQIYSGVSGALLKEDKSLAFASA